MAIVELNHQVHQRLAAENEEYKRFLLTQPPDEIVRRSFETAVKDDIVMISEDLEMCDEFCHALLKMASPLEQIFKDYRDSDSSYYVEELLNQIIGCAEWEAEKQHRQHIKEAR